MLKIKALDLDDDAELRGYADVRIAAQAVDRPGEPASSRERIIESLRQPNPDFSELMRLVALRDGEVVGMATVGLFDGVNEQLGFVTTHEVVVVSRSF